MKSVRTEECHVGLFREFVGTACCTYGQSHTTTGAQIDTDSEPAEDYLFHLKTKCCSPIPRNELYRWTLNSLAHGKFE